MKRPLFVFLFTVGCTFLPITYANGVTEGCPDTWKLDTSSNSGYEELLQARNRLGGDLAMTEPVLQYQNYSGELGPLKAPKNIGALTIEDVYLYGKTQVNWKIEVQQKNCPGKTTFIFNRGTLSESLGLKSVLANVDPQTWATANEGLFIDFTKVPQFGACIKSIQRFFTPPNLGAQLEENQLVVGALSNLVRQRTFNQSCGLSPGVNLRKHMVYQDLTPECRFFSEDSGRGTLIQKSATCALSLALPTRDSLIIFTNFTLSEKDYKVNVVCTKGKLRKTVNSYRGYEFQVKCPAGYKRS